ncbi:MAG TPA: carboxylesterase family protein [Thermoanaerobaculia bacterium]|nr:carboxylesterase family protein [Thermoanaerobaculia bacterium]
MATRRSTPLSFLLLAVCGSLAVWAQKPACSTATIQTSSGPVCGMTSSAPITGSETVTASAYLGIPYAVPPVGSRRWQYSKPFMGSAPLQATAYGNECPQSTVVPKAPSASSNRCTDGQTLGPGESEDCLFLNVWVPSGAQTRSRLPVMVFIPGGAFYQGSGGAPSTGNLYDNETANCSTLWDGIGYETPQILAGLTSAIKTPKKKTSGKNLT